ncbi:hypothetical protein LZP73_08485 [Shewanella sp. AS16]|uniref:hypothetical protein n=1 Tax=Shewanella sp. AS16 TaxID=2907625 RepID=UPI001F1DC5A3|nr:hypothetical protein [Shewanella sp. AS16]MCE9686255.1 hypothetical protein [Shewanella sp. AS16]
MFFCDSTWAEDLLNTETEGEFVFQQCHAFADAGNKYGFDFSMFTSTPKARDRSLYIFDRHKITADWIVIDTTLSDIIIPNTLKFQAHTLKHKKFLKEQKVLLLGTGKNYAVLEQNAQWLKENMAADVKIWLGGKDYWSYLTGNTAVMAPLTISAAEFVSEADRGKWIYIDTEEALSSAVHVLTTVKTLDRYLVINPELKLKDTTPVNAILSIFLLQDGINSLEKYAYQQGVILTAKKNRESHERCNERRAL